MKRFIPVVLLATGVLAATPTLSAGAEAAGGPTKEGVDFFEKHIRPVLADRCYKCHSAQSEKLKGKLLLDTRDGVLRGGENGPVLVPGDPDKSRLVVSIRGTDPDLQMPPKDRLPKEQIAAFEQWVKMGAPDPRTAPAGAVPAVSAKVEPYDWVEQKKWWSFQPVKEPPVPVVADKEGAGDPIDRFLQAGWEAKGLRPVGPADRRALIRRATYDLTGLPTTPEEVDAFLADESAQAFAKVVDRLLASPAYGERWGRHWLDVVRYADTSGCNADFPVPQAAKYRDYVIDAFNADKPYDQFVREQVAGDLLPAKDDAERREHVIATGYLAIARRFGSRNAEFHLTIEDTIDNLGKAVLGLSVSCARCHDHKFDPISNRDYYALYGIFAGTKYAFPGTEIYNHTKDFTPLGTPEENEQLKEYEAKLAELDQRIEDLKNDRLKLSSRLKAAKERDEKGPKDGAAATTRPAADEIAELTAALAKAKSDMADVQDELKRLEARPPTVDKAYAASEGRNPADAKIQRKGDPKDLGDVVPRGFLTILGGQKLPADEKGSGRLELAQWLTDPANPLTARVMANRIWLHHFGAGLVKTPNDFGHRGRAPTNPALLDYLASQFVQSGWSVKAMHRRVMLTRAYQLASTDDTANSTTDPANDLLWRQNPRRLSAEEIRDTVLVLGGSLDRARPSAPHPFPPELEWRYTQHKPFVADYPSTHRSVYLMQQRIRKQPFLAVFDGADTNATTADRPFSTTALQALFMMNDPFLHDQADRFAVRIGLAFDDDPSRIAYAYRLCYGRPAAADETAVGLQYLADVREKLRAAGTPWDRLNRAALASYVRVLMSGNEFVFLD